MASHHSSDSENETEQSANGFLRGRSVHEALGGGKVADLLLWRSRNVSAALLLGVTVIWFLFEVVQYNFITFLCHISITAIHVFFNWNTGTKIFKWNPPKIPEIILQESTFTHVASTFHAKFNQFLSKLLDIASGRDLPNFLLATFGLHVLSVVGTYFSFLNLLYFGFLSMETLPFLYDRYQDDFDDLVGKVFIGIKRKYRMFDSKFLNKIPRGPVYEKKAR